MCDLIQPVASGSTTAPSPSTVTTRNTTSRAVSDRERGMRDRMPYRATPIKRPTLQSACVRLHDLHGEAAKSWENRMCGEGSDYQRVARMNLVLRELGMLDKVAELMAPVEASIAGAACTAGTERTRERVTDAEEDVLQARYEDDPSAETARPLLQKRAVMRQASLDDDAAIAQRHRMTL